MFVDPAVTLYNRCPMNDPTQYAWLALIGLVAGWIGGLMGVGGSLVMIPGMTMLFGGGRQHLLQAAAMIVNVAVIGPAALRHLRAGATLPSILMWTVPAATLAALVGVAVSNARVFEGAGQGYLQVLFGLFLVYAVTYNLIRLRRRDKLPDIDAAAAARLPRWRLVALVGLPAGFIGGLLGIAGGAVAGPAQQVFLRMPLRRAIANSTAIVLLSSAVAAVAKNATLAEHGSRVGESLRLAATLIPTAFAGAWVGASLVDRWPRWLIRTIFVVVLGVSAARMFDAGWKSLAG